VVTLLVFWLAHVYSAILERGLLQGRLRGSAIRDTVVDELAMIEAPVLSVLFLLLGAAGLLDHRLAVNLALANGVVELYAWGVAVARRLGWSWPAALAFGLVDAAFGVVIILLKAVLH
jgi:hypothetical protein